MTEINISPSLRKKPGVPRIRKMSLKVDMTPMVDLGFLLIAFFIFTTTISRPSVVNLYMPKDGEPSKSSASKSLTILLGNHETIYYYFGTEEDAFKSGSIQPTSFSVYNGIGNIIRQKQRDLSAWKPAGRDSLVVLIKPGYFSSYRHIVNMLDEMLINNVKRYAIVDPGKYDSLFLSNALEHK